MEKLISLLLLNLMMGLGTLSAQIPAKRDSLWNSKNDNRGNQMNKNDQDSSLWYRRTDSMMKPLNRIQRDSMMKGMNKTQRDGMMNYRKKLQNDSMRMNKNRQRTDSMMKPRY